MAMMARLVALVMLSCVLCFLVSQSQGSEAIKCDSQWPTCVSVVNASCSGNVECDIGLYCDFGGNLTCVPQKPSGSACDYDDECLGNNYVCFNSTCTAVSWNGEVGQSCNSKSNCRQSLYCNVTGNDPQIGDVGICIQFTPIGGICSVDGEGNFVKCSPNAVCNLGFCIPVMSLKEGQSCTADGSLVCQGGLWCQPSVGIPDVGVCAKQFKSSNKTCYNSSDCNPFEICACSGVGNATTCQVPRSYPSSSQAKKYVDLITCSLKENCDMDDTQACCESDQCDLYYSLLGDSYFMSGCNPNRFSHCKIPKGKPSLSLAGKIVIGAGVGVGVIIAVGLIVFFVKRSKREKYAPLLKK